jgi:hypothetical protein
MFIHLKVAHFYRHHDKEVHTEFKVSIASLMFIDIFLIAKFPGTNL